MNDPCKTCLVQVNCTAICEAKENFQTLLERAMGNFQLGFKVKGRQDRALFKRWKTLDMENRLDMANILMRASRLKNGVL